MNAVNDHALHVSAMKSTILVGVRELGPYDVHTGYTLDSFQTQYGK